MVEILFNENDSHKCDPFELLGSYLSFSLLWKCLLPCSIITQGRKARLKVTRSSTAAQNRYSRGSHVSTYSNYSTNSMNRLASNGTSTFAGEEHSNGTSEP